MLDMLVLPSTLVLLEEVFDRAVIEMEEVKKRETSIKRMRDDYFTDKEWREFMSDLEDSAFQSFAYEIYCAACKGKLSQSEFTKIFSDETDFGWGEYDNSGVLWDWFKDRLRGSRKLKKGTKTDAEKMIKEFLSA